MAASLGERYGGGPALGGALQVPPAGALQPPGDGPQQRAAAGLGGAEEQRRPPRPEAARGQARRRGRTASASAGMGAYQTTFHFVLKASQKMAPRFNLQAICGLPIPGREQRG